MGEYYLISQLPSLDAISENAPLPITEERFLELCRRFLGKKACSELEAITLLPPIDPEKSKSALITAWNEAERDLRLALAKVRADRIGKTFDLQGKTLPAQLYRAATSALEEENPLEAENDLLHHRLRVLESLRPADIFSLDYVFYYAIKLKLILRLRQFDATLGQAAYKNIYSSILYGERLEA